MCQKKLRVNQFGYTPDEWIKILPKELPVDGISFRSIVMDFRNDFKLSLDAVIHYVRLAIYELYDCGARPVIGAGQLKGTSYDWVYQAQYGKTKEEIAENVIKEWKEDDYKDPDYMKLWFALLDENCYVPEEYGELIAVKASSHI